MGPRIEKQVVFRISENTRYCLQFLRNSGERIRAIRLAMDTLNMTFNQAQEYVDGLAYKFQLG